LGQHAVIHREAITLFFSSNYSGVKNNNNLLILNDFKYFSCFLSQKSAGWHGFENIKTQYVVFIVN